MMSLCKRHFFIHSFYNCLRTQIELSAENIIMKRQIHFFLFVAINFVEADMSLQIQDGLVVIFWESLEF